MLEFIFVISGSLALLFILNNVIPFLVLLVIDQCERDALGGKTLEEYLMKQKEEKP